MKLKLIILSVIISIVVVNSTNAQPVAPLNGSQPAVDGISQAMKLQYYAGACNAAQVELLLAKDPNFDIYSSGSSSSPVMVAIDKYISSNNTNNVKSCSECLATIKAIIKDARYKLKEIPNNTNTDFMYLILRQNRVTVATLPQSGYNILFGGMLDELDKKPGFDLNYNVPTNSDSTPCNAMGALAVAGRKSTFCLLASRYPNFKTNLDNKSRSTAYTPLMFAAMFGNLEIVNALASNGADYYLTIPGFGIFPALELAQKWNRTLVVGYLDRRRLGQEPASVTIQDYCK